MRPAEEESDACNLVTICVTSLTANCVWNSTTADTEKYLYSGPEKMGQLSLHLRGHWTGHMGVHNRPLRPGACIPQLPWPPRVGVHPVVFWTPRRRDVRTRVVKPTATCDDGRHLLREGKTVPKMKMGVWATAVNPFPSSVMYNHVLSFHVTIHLHATFPS